MSPKFPAAAWAIFMMEKDDPKQLAAKVSSQISPDEELRDATWDILHWYILSGTEFRYHKSVVSKIPICIWTKMVKFLLGPEKPEEAWELINALFRDTEVVPNCPEEPIDASSVICSLESSLYFWNRDYEVEGEEGRMDEIVRKAFSYDEGTRIHACQLTAGSFRRNHLEKRV